MQVSDHFAFVLNLDFLSRKQGLAYSYRLPVGLIHYGNQFILGYAFVQLNYARPHEVCPFGNEGNSWHVHPHLFKEIILQKGLEAWNPFFPKPEQAWAAVNCQQSFLAQFHPVLPAKKRPSKLPDQHRIKLFQLVFVKTICFHRLSIVTSILSPGVFIACISPLLRCLQALSASNPNVLPESNPPSLTTISSMSE